jgi:hypothetical protein
MRCNQPPGRRERAQSRRIQAFELRKCGASYRDIGRALGVSEAQAHRDITERLRQLEKVEEQSAKQLRCLELARLDVCISALWPRIQSGDTAAVHAFIRVSERRAALVGLDMPSQHELFGKDRGPIEVESKLDLSKVTDEQIEQLAAIVASAEA